MVRAARFLDEIVGYQDRTSDMHLLTIEEYEKNDNGKAQLRSSHRSCGPFNLKELFLRLNRHKKLARKHYILSNLRAA